MKYVHIHFTNVIQLLTMLVYIVSSSSFRYYYVYWIFLMTPGVPCVRSGLSYTSCCISQWLIQPCTLYRDWLTYDRCQPCRISLAIWWLICMFWGGHGNDVWGVVSVWKTAQAWSMWSLQYVHQTYVKVERSLHSGWGYMIHTMCDCWPWSTLNTTLRPWY